MKSPFVTELIEIIKTETTNICLVLEYLDTDLDNLLKSKESFSEPHLIKIIYNMLCSISFIHKSNVMHRDIKCANILVT